MSLSIFESLGWIQKAVACVIASQEQRYEDALTEIAVLDAVMHGTGKYGDCAISLAEFHRLLGGTPQLDTNLQYTHSSCV